MIIKFLNELQTPPMDIHARLVKVIGKEGFLSIQTVRKWVREFKEGRSECSDVQRPGRPAAVSTDEMTERIQALVHEDRRITIDQIARELDISHGTAWKIINEKLGMRKVTSRWIPHLLSEKQKVKRMLVASQHLRRFRRDPAVLNRIVASDESWAHSWEPELKRQSAEWRLGVILDWPVPVGTTVNGEYYQWILREKVRPAVRRKRPNLLDEGVILLHDNASPHFKRCVVEMLAQWEWEVLSHPPYSPDMSPCDFFLFAAIKEPLRGQRFQSEEAVNAAWKASIDQVNAAGTEQGIMRLPHLWEKCVAADDAYFES